MIIFDMCTYVTDIIKNGIGANENNANSKLLLVARYLVTETKYKPNKIKEKLKKCAEDYFRGLPESSINKEIEIIFSKAKRDLEKEAEKLKDETEIGYENFVEDMNYSEPKKLILYENEMKTISKLDRNYRN